MNMNLPKKQKGGNFDASYVLSCSEKLLDIPLGYLVKTPLFQKVISLDKAKQDLLMHSVLAGAGGAMVLAGAGAIAESGVSVNDTVEYIKNISTHFNEVSSMDDVYDVLNLTIDESKERAPSSLMEVWGTMSTGALNCARNLGQIWFLRSGADGGLDLSKPENRQKRRRKQSFSNFISGTTNIPQLLEGLTLFDPVRTGTAGSAVAAYFKRARDYDKLYHNHLTDGHSSNDEEINKEIPSNLMIGRGLGQTGLSVELIEKFGLVSGTCIILAGLGQTFGAVVMKYSDKSYKDRVANDNGVDIM